MNLTRTNTFRGKKKNILEDLINPSITKKVETKNIIEGRSLFILGKNNRFRLFINKVISHKLFDPFILFLIIFTTLTMTLDSPLNDPASNVSIFLANTDIVVTILFSLEAAFKIIVFGFLFNGKYSYLRNPWNILDIVIVLFSVSNYKSLYALDFVSCIEFT